MTILSIDFESRSTVDLRRAGVYTYAAHPETGLWLMAWAFDDEEPALWHPGGFVAGQGFVAEALPRRIEEHIQAGGEIRAWNAMFERVMWREIMVKRYGAPPVLDEQWVDTAAEAAAMALPRGLDQAAQVVGVPFKKDAEGHRLMMRMARPRKIVDGKPVWWDEPERLARLGEYCKQDVRVERALAKCVRRLTPHERQVYLLDQRVNDRGVCIDRPLIVAATAIAEEGIRRADAALVELTGGGIQSVKNNGQLLRWIREQGIATDSVGKPAVQELLEGDLDPIVREVLQVRVDAGRSSVAKLRAMLEVAGMDDRLRGLLLYHGASTGRWTGKLVQPQNFPRGDVPDAEDLIPLIEGGHYGLLDLIAPPLAVVSSLLRGMLVPTPGLDMVAGDYSAIEARVLNWLAGQEDVLDTFREYDTGDTSKDPYKIMAVRMGRGHSAAEISKEDRQAGKAAELGCGFQMGAKKFVDAAWKVYQVRVTIEQAKQAVKAYRSSHDRVKNFWYEAERACLEAIHRPGAVQIFGGRRNLRTVVAGAYLYILLPSGRPLCYAAPRAVEREIVVEDENGEEKRFTKVCMEYFGVDPFTKQWGRLRAYGGFLVENIVQAVARDFMVNGMEQVGAAGYDVLLTVHDEVIAERASADAHEFEAALSTLPSWGGGCPVAAEARVGRRYRK